MTTNCAQFKNHQKMLCVDFGYEHFNSIDKFDVKKLREFIKRYFGYHGSPFRYPKNMETTRRFKIMPHQIFLGKWMSHHHKHVQGILVYNRIGSGKTLSSIVAGLCHIAYHSGKNKFPKITVVTPANLIDNYKEELRGPGPKQVLINNNAVDYGGASTKNVVENPFFTGNKQNVFKNKKLINKHWDFITHQKFINDVFNKSNGLPGKLVDKLKEPERIWIFDEIHNLVSDVGENYKKISNALKNYLHPTSKLILLTGTPIVDSGHEIGLTLNLLNPRIRFPDNKQDFDKLSNDQLKYMMYGYISYFSGGNPKLYPEKTVRIVHHQFNRKSPQYKNYLKVYSKELPKKYRDKNMTDEKQQSGFFLKSIMAANVYRTKKMLEELDNTPKNDKFEFVKNNMSLKYANIAEHISKCKGTVFCFSPYLDAGVKSIAMILRLLGFSDYFSNKSGPKYVLWTGEIKASDKEEFSQTVLDTFNDESNIDGSKIKVILATRAISEGITFKNVRHLHICSNFWNDNVTKQAIGRCDRLNSHSDLPQNERTIKIYKHIMKVPLKLTTDNDLLTEFSVEEYVQIKSQIKEKTNNKLYKLLREVAIDCDLNKNGNKHRTYKFKENGNVEIRDDVTDEIVSKNINVNQCNVRNTEVPTRLKTISRNTRLARKVLFPVMNSKMTAQDLENIDKIKNKLLNCVRKNSGKIKNVPRAINLKRNIKEYLEKSKINGDANKIYKQLVGASTIVSDTDVSLIEDVREYLYLKRI